MHFQKELYFFRWWKGAVTPFCTTAEKLEASV